MFTPWLKPFTDLVFPRNCLVCRTYHRDTELHPLCPACFEKIPFNRPPFCRSCSRHLEGENAGGLCAGCHRHPPGFDYAWAMTSYEGIMQLLLPRFKFHQKTALRKTFRRVAAEFFRRHPVSFAGTDFLLPVPLHPSRERDRGYNQAGLIAEACAEALGLPIKDAGLSRARLTAPQTELKAKERWTNVLGAFTIKNSSLVREKHVILVDDLLTTGATAGEAAKTLKSAGAARVGVIALAMAY